MRNYSESRARNNKCHCLRPVQLIQVWAQTFQNQPDLSGVVQSYQELKNKGIEFPAPEIESVVPIYTPQRVSVTFCDLFISEQATAAISTV